MKQLNTQELPGTKMIFPVMNSLLFLSPAKIIRLEAKSSYTKIFFDDRKPVTTCKVLKEYETLLKPLGFIRTHRSHLINKNRIASIDDNGNIYMDDCSIAGISRRKRTAVLKQLQ